MSSRILVTVVAEGPTEEKFIKRIVVPYLISKNITMIPTVLHGNVNFERVKRDVINRLKNNKFMAVSYFVDYYGLKDWPQKDSIPANATPRQIAGILNKAAKDVICGEIADDFNP